MTSKNYCYEELGQKELVVFKDTQTVGDRTVDLKTFIFLIYSSMFFFYGSEYTPLQ